MQDIHTTVRIPKSLLGKVDKLAKSQAADPSLAWVRVNRSSVLRQAILRGLEVLEREAEAGKSRAA